MFLSKIPIRGVTKAARLFASQATNGTVKTTTSNCDKNDLPSNCDIAIIGGGAVGSSIAYWLKERVGDDLKVVVIEKDRCVSIFD